MKSIGQCKQCKKEIYRNRQRPTSFCSQSCASLFAWSKKETKKAIKCHICEILFRPCRGQKTCSMKCKLEKGRRKRRRICIVCKAEFQTPIGTYQGKYCSNKCYWNSGNAGGPGKKRFRNTESARYKCLNCGAEGTSYARSRPRIYCSNKCAREHLRGENSPLWRGQRRQERGSSWKRLSREARERDGCCITPFCGKTEKDIGENLSVDHIVPFRMTVLYGQTDGIDPNHIDNLVCLCRSHHAKKTNVETRIIRGDIIGFLAEIRTIIPEDRISKALQLWGLSRQSPVQNNIPFDGIPKFINAETNKKPPKSGFRGVYPGPQGSNKWIAQIYTKGKAVHLGVFCSPEEASSAHEDARRKKFQIG